MAAPATAHAGLNFAVTIDGNPIDMGQVESLIVDQDRDQPDMCAVALKTGTRQLAESAEKVKVGDVVEVKLGHGRDERQVIFIGEVVGLEPTYGGRHTRLVVRAFSRLHRLLRGRQSRTFLKQTDSDIVSAIAGANGLSVQCDATSIKHEHIYQHNQTDLEFLRVRAAANGFEVGVEDKTLYFRKPQAERDTGITLTLEQDLLSFAPRLSSAGIVQKVEVRGWDPVQKKELVGTASAPASRLGDRTGADMAKVFGQKVAYTVDRPIFSTQEAKAIAEAKLTEHLMGYITGEGVCIGNPKLKAGIVITVSLAAQSGVPSRFAGKYLLTGVSHRVTTDARAGGYETTFRVSRDAEAVP